MAVKIIPDSFHSVTPFIMVNDADKLITFMKEALGATESYILKHPDGTIWHAQMMIGNSKILIADAMGKAPATPAALYLYVPDADKSYQKAIDNGATSVMNPEDQFYGDRTGGVTDEFGNTWWFATHLEDLSSEEIERRAKECLDKSKAA